MNLSGSDCRMDLAVRGQAEFIGLNLCEAFVDEQAAGCLWLISLEGLSSMMGLRKRGKLCGETALQICVSAFSSPALKTEPKAARPGRSPRHMSFPHKAHALCLCWLQSHSIIQIQAVMSQVLSCISSKKQQHDAKITANRFRNKHVLVHVTLL